ncbi:class F sortase [Streptomyces sp. NPDC127084]|uniref:class F sortase n=1 Tax=Streptomyces sp. NPDC127084 TaxID=3347133 RepID=UPI00365FEDA7
MTFRQPSDEPAPSFIGSLTSLRQALLWPAATVGAGALLVYGSFDAATLQLQPSPTVVVVTPSLIGPNPLMASPPAGPGPAMKRSVPQRITIPAISVNAPFTPLTLAASGQLNAPPANDKNLVGWYNGGATPGERGTAIVAGHFDTKTGPAVFVNLKALKKGSKVEVTRADGKIATFKVDSVESFSKAKFPSARVYNDAQSAQLRLITCGGQYDRKAKDYKENVVVFAHLESSRKA